MQQPFPKGKPGLRKTPLPPPKPKDTSIFGGRPYLRPGEHEWKFIEKGPYRTPGGTLVPKAKRIELAKRFRGGKFGPLRDPGDYRRLIGELEKEMRITRDWAKKKKLKQDIDYYKHMGGL
jgi:hypothetical protein